MEACTLKIVITGAKGLIGWHSAVRLYAANCAARFKKQEEPFDFVALDHAGFNHDETLGAAIRDADAILHFAGVNRGPDHVVEEANPAIAYRLAETCRITKVRPHIVYANSTHLANDTPYGRSKRVAGKILSTIGGPYSDLMFPHVFGECARPRYNNVTATFVEAVIAGDTPEINPEGRVSLIHAGAAAQAAIDAITESRTGPFTFHHSSRDIAVSELFEILHQFHSSYQNNIFPDLSDPFTIDLFNTYRSAICPDAFPRPLKINTDERGTLFEVVKGGRGGQTFLSTTMPRTTRGDHFHLNKIERFVVIQGQAVIRIRKVLSNEVLQYHVSGTAPAAVDIPTLHTHSIENVGNNELLTLFWANKLFDPANPDTFTENVIK